MRLLEVDLAAHDLPVPGDPQARWTPARKATLLELFDEEHIPFSDLEEAYALSGEEFCEWRRQVQRFGVPGLRTTRFQIYKAN
jgi:hypothetical protein